MKRILLACLISGIMLTQSLLPMETTSVSARDLLLGAGVGAAAGCGEVICNQPLIVLKNLLQLPKDMRAQAFSELTPKTFLPTFYRGLGANLTGMGPATAFQLAVDAGLNGVLSGNTIQEKLARAGCAGALSAIVSTPIERVIVMQQALQCSPSVAIKAIMTHEGIPGFNKGFALTAIREGIWAPAYLAVFPALEKKISEATQSKTVGLFGAAASTALLMGTVTQPVDTIKTVLQADGKSSLRGIVDAVRSICTEFDEKSKKPGGMRNLWKGLLPRTTRASLAIPFLKYSTEYLKSKMEEIISVSNKG